MSRSWTTEQYHHYLATLEEPKDKPLADSFAPTVRVEKRISTGRCKRTTVKRPDLGVTFASLTEERFFEHLRGLEGVTHIDIHPVFTLPGGIRYHGDFISWRTLPHGERAGSAWEVKGSEKHANATAIRRIKRLFDSAHPMAPLRIVIWDRAGKAWREIP